MSICSLMFHSRHCHSMLTLTGDLFSHERRGSLPPLRANRFLLSMLSPVWQAKLCGDLGSVARWKLNLDGDDPCMFSHLLALSCGKSIRLDGHGAMFALGRMSNQYQVESVQCAVEDTLVKLLEVENCGRFLEWSYRSGLLTVERASRALALREFDTFVETPAFMELGEDMLRSLLEADALRTEAEEGVFEGVVRWMKGGDSGTVRGERLLQTIKFPFMDAAYLADLPSDLLPDRFCLSGLRLESLELKCTPRHLWKNFELQFLDASALSQRGRLEWKNYLEGGELRIDTFQVVQSLAVDSNYVCCGLEGGIIIISNRSTMEATRFIDVHKEPVRALLFAGKLLISASDDRSIRGWDLASGQCKGILEGHENRVTSLAVSGNRLVSGSWDATLRVWRMEGEMLTWLCERELHMQGSPIECVVAWRSKVACGSSDGHINVWGAEMWTLEHTLCLHKNRVTALVVSGDTLFSSSFDNTLRAWSTQTWACMHEVVVYPDGSPQSIFGLAACGSHLVGCSSQEPSYDMLEHDLLVWDIVTLQQLHKITQPQACEMICVVSDGGEVFASAGFEVVVWGCCGQGTNKVWEI